MKEYQVTVYECEYCHGRFTNEKEKCEAHEKKCADNPATKYCRTCKHNELTFSDRLVTLYECALYPHVGGVMWHTCEQYEPREIK